MIGVVDMNQITLMALHGFACVRVGIEGFQILIRNARVAKSEPARWTDGNASFQKREWHVHCSAVILFWMVLREHSLADWARNVL